MIEPPGKPVPSIFQPNQPKRKFMRMPVKDPLTIPENMFVGGNYARHF